MKRLRYGLLFVIVFMMFLAPIKASTRTYERNSSNNYGVSKKWDMNSYRIGRALNTPYVDASEKIYDYSYILTDSEEEELYELMIKFIEHTGFDIVFLSQDLTYYNDSTNEDYATDFYDYNDFGIDTELYDGVLIFRNTYSSDPYYDMYSFGEAQLYFDFNRMDKILDDMYSSYRGGYYLSGTKKAIEELTSYYDKGVANKNSYIDENGFVYEKEDKLGTFLRGLFHAMPVAGIITLVIVLILIAKNKMVKTAYNAQEYIVRNSLKFSDKRDVFIRSHTSSYTHSSSSGGGGSSGGGSSSHSGSSGGGHTSGGGRHG